MVFIVIYCLLLLIFFFWGVGWFFFNGIRNWNSQYDCRNVVLVPCGAAGWPDFEGYSLQCSELCCFMCVLYTYIYFTQGFVFLETMDKGEYYAQALNAHRPSPIKVSSKYNYWERNQWMMWSIVFLRTEGHDYMNQLLPLPLPTCTYACTHTYTTERASVSLYKSWFWILSMQVHWKGAAILAFTQGFVLLEKCKTLHKCLCSNSFRYYAYFLIFKIMIFWSIILITFKII